MEKITISPSEEALLHGNADRSQMILVRKKANTILLASNNVPPAIIASVMGKEESTVITWIRDWTKTRMLSVTTGHQGNLNASKLTPAQRTQVLQDLATPPEANGLPAGFWDVPKLRTHLSTKFEVVYESDTSYHYLLRLAGLELKYPDKLDRRRNEAVVEERMTQIREELTLLIQDPAWEVFYADEVRLDQEAITRRAWLPVGRPTVLKVDRQVQAQSYLGLLGQATGRCHLHKLAWQNSETIITALETFLTQFPGKKIAIVWDNAAFHKSKTIRAELSKGGKLERVHLIAMPPYAPDHNPIEHVWGQAKQNISGIQRDHFDQTTTAFEEYINSRLFKYQI